MRKRARKVVAQRRKPEKPEEALIDRLFRAASFVFVDWANTPKMLELELRRPAIYRLIVWPPYFALVWALVTFTLWRIGVFTL